LGEIYKVAERPLWPNFEELFKIIVADAGYKNGCEAFVAKISGIILIYSRGCGIQLPLPSN